MNNDETWKRDAACRRDNDAERLALTRLFFAPVLEISPEILALCESCRVRQACLQYALTNNLKYGVFGGLNARERAKLTNDTEDIE